MAIFDRVFKGAEQPDPPAPQKPPTPTRPADSVAKSSPSISPPSQQHFAPASPPVASPPPLVEPPAASNAPEPVRTAAAAGTSAPCSVIGATMMVEGEIESNRDILIRGQVKGSIFSQGKVTLAKESIVEADIEAVHLVLHGHLVGNANLSESAHITASGSLEGVLVTPNLIVAEGASFKGEILMREPTETTATSTPGAKKGPESASAKKSQESVTGSTTQKDAFLPGKVGSASTTEKSGATPSTSDAAKSANPNADVPASKSDDKKDSGKKVDLAGLEQLAGISKTPGEKPAESSGKAEEAKNKPEKTGKATEAKP